MKPTWRDLLEFIQEKVKEEGDIFPQFLRLENEENVHDTFLSPENENQ